MSRSGVPRSVTAHAGSTTTSDAIAGIIGTIVIEVDWSRGFRQLGDIRRDLPRLVEGEQLGVSASFLVGKRADRAR